MVTRVVSRSFIVLAAATALALVSATPGAAYGGGPANWQLTFAGTGPGFGFWGWCALSGANASTNGLPSSGTTGDCEFSEYSHGTSPSFTCEESLNLSSNGATGDPAWEFEASPVTRGTDFFFSGTATIHPPSQSANCPSIPGSFPSTFSDADSLLPVIPGHTNLNGTGFFGTFELQINETPFQ